METEKNTIQRLEELTGQGDKVVVRAVKDKLVWTPVNGTKKHWYIFKDHRWVSIQCSDIPYDKMDKFGDDEFESKLDNNVNLVGFDNGILDIEQQVFREGKPEDYVSLTTGWDYPSEPQ